MSSIIIKKHPVLSGKGHICAVRRRDEENLRSLGTTASLSRVADGEYLDFCVVIKNNESSDYVCKEASVSIDGQSPLGYEAFTVPAGGELSIRLGSDHMKPFLTPGNHTALWTVDGQRVCKTTFTFCNDMNWESVFTFPKRSEGEIYNRTNNIRSPYICAYLKMPKYARITEYMVDFKADYLPRGTYCCMGNWSADNSSLKERYASYEPEDPSTSAYAGFQNIYDGSHVSIMSFWDVFCKDHSGKRTTLRAKRVHPRTTEYSEDFGNEGTGAHCSVDYPWQAGKWYRMHLKCKNDNSDGTTLVEQWVVDLESGAPTLLCVYDTLIKNSTMRGDFAIFLENYMVEHAADVRTLEFCNVKYYNESIGEWCRVKEAYIAPQSGLPDYRGSYNFGATENRFWMITGGIGGDWYGSGKGKKGTNFKVD